jgi:polyisoprenoid-binding protein YceI
MTRKLILGSLVLLAMAGSGWAQTSTWAIDPAHSAVGFSVKHMMVSNVRGYFNTFSGTLEGQGEDPTTATIAVTIDVSSIDTREPKRNDHLRSGDFFDVAKYPTIAFKSKRVEKAGQGKLRVIGDLTIHGVSKEAVLDVDGLTPQTKDPWGGTRVGAHATTRINRKDFGLLWNKVLETGGVLVGEDVDITIDVELVKKAVPTK